MGRLRERLPIAALVGAVLVFATGLLLVHRATAAPEDALGPDLVYFTVSTLLVSAVSALGFSIFRRERGR